MNTNEGDSVRMTDGGDVDQSALALFLQQFGEMPSEESLQALFEKVERAKQEWEATADALPELICLLDDRGRVLRANRAVEAWGLGQVVAVRDHDLHQLLHPECRDEACYVPRLVNDVPALVAAHKPAEFESYDKILKRYVRVQLRPMPPHKRPAQSAAAFVVEDISLRKQAEIALRRHAERLETMNEIGEAILAACAPDDIAQAALGRLRHLIPFRQARVTLWNAEAKKYRVMAAYAHGATHLRPGMVYPADDFHSQERQPDQHLRVDDLAELPDLSGLERQLVREGVRAYMSTPLIAEGKFIGTISLGSDKVADFDHEHEAIAYQLADMLAIAIRQAQLYEKLNQANEELQAALKSKDQMIQNVSHELRSPLYLISGYTDLLDSTDLGALTPEQKHALHVMRQQEGQLLTMVERLLALQSVKAESLQKDLMDPGLWLRQAVEAWATRADTAGVEIRCETPDGLPSLLVDIESLTHVIYNLLENAIKFSPDGGVVRVRARHIGSRIVIAVSDEGIGLAADKLAQVFSRFYQVDPFMARRFKGMGIGLALCRAIVEAHRGHIWAESRGEGHGSTFCFELPVSPGAACGKDVP